VNLSAPFIERPIATTLLTTTIALVGFFAYSKLPVTPLPQQVACTTIWVSRRQILSLSIFPKMRVERADHLAASLRELLHA
jgi:hypothetical protein